jgi:hypothetical protein
LHPARAAVKRPPIRLHWSLRTLAVLAGLPLFLIGGLSVAVCCAMPVQPGAAGVIAHGIVLAIVGGIALLGALLLWFGIRGRVPRLWRSAAPRQDFAPADSTSAAPPELADFGAFIAQCGPLQAGLTNYLIFGAAMLVFAVLCFLAPSTFLVPKPADAAWVSGCCWVFGGISLLFGLGMMWHPLFGQNKTILLYERGLIERVGGTSFAISLDEIEVLRVQEWYDHRFAPRTFNVRAKIRGNRELSFSSALRGESDRIIAYLADHVARTEMVPFQA